MADRVSKKDGFRVTMTDKDYFAEFETFVRQYLNIGLGSINFKADKVTILYKEDKPNIIKIEWVNVYMYDIKTEKTTAIDELDVIQPIWSKKHNSIYYSTVKFDGDKNNTYFHRYDLK